jgi:sugar lactone lactonase YvrE
VILPVALTPAEDLCGESPRWDAAAKELVWIDATAGRVCRRTSTHQRMTDRYLQAPIAALAKTEDDCWIVGSERGLELLYPDGNIQVIELPSHLGPISVNELGVAPDGSLLVGTAYLQGDKPIRPGQLLRVSEHNEVQVLDEGFALANGIGISPNGKICYVTDSLARTIYAYDLASPTRFENKRAFATFGVDDGLPDGLAVDAEGCVWSALWYGGKVVRISPQGKVMQTIALPCSQVSSVGFGGEDLRTLYITTAKEYWESSYALPQAKAQSTDAGSLFGCIPGVTGTVMPLVRWNPKSKQL